jgi:gamma-glutamyl-gamma-aminobutyrate hydrolase PuuD
MADHFVETLVIGVALVVAVVRSVRVFMVSAVTGSDSAVSSNSAVRHHSSSVVTGSIYSDSAVSPKSSITPVASVGTRIRSNSAKGQAVAVAESMAVEAVAELAGAVESVA